MTRSVVWVERYFCSDGSRRRTLLERTCLEGDVSQSIAIFLSQLPPLVHQRIAIDLVYTPLGLRTATQAPATGQLRLDFMFYKIVRTG